MCVCLCTGAACQTKASNYMYQGNRYNAQIIHTCWMLEGQLFVEPIVYHRYSFQQRPP